VTALESVAAPARSVAQLEAHDLFHRYGPRVGLERLSFALTAPGIVAVTGPNGAGKSTLLRILAGLLHPTSGRSALIVEGHAVPPADRRRHLGFLSPALAFYEEFEVAENLGFAAEALGLAEPERVVASALERVELSERARDRAGALSSGLKQRLRIAFAILQSPPVLFLDEPGSHLDEAGRERLSELIRDEARRALVVVATNEPREWNLAERRIELRGRGLGRPA
jgi:ABC-type multidrug transport system ATPase subunit